MGISWRKHILTIPGSIWKTSLHHYRAAMLFSRLDPLCIYTQICQQGGLQPDMDSLSLSALNYYLFKTAAKDPPTHPTNLLLGQILMVRKMRNRQTRASAPRPRKHGGRRTTGTITALTTCCFSSWMAALGLTHYPQFLTTQLGLAPQLSSPCSASLGTRDDDNGDVAASEPIVIHLCRPS